MYKKCELCGKEFIPYNPQRDIQKYCSKKCRKVIENKLLNKRRREHTKAKWEQVIERECLSCLKVFKPTKHQGAKFCCEPCQSRYYRKQNPDKVKKWKLADYHRHKAKRLATGQKNKDKSRFGGLRRKVLERDNFSCTKCDKNYPTFSIVVHHIDKDKTNNTMDNLVTLCRSCHNITHEFLTNKIRK